MHPNPIFLVLTAFDQLLGLSFVSLHLLRGLTISPFPMYGGEPEWGTGLIAEWLVCFHRVWTRYRSDRQFPPFSTQIEQIEASS